MSVSSGWLHRDGFIGMASSGWLHRDVCLGSWAVRRVHPTKRILYPDGNE
jgi:hypothetical protein